MKGFLAQGITTAQFAVDIQHDGGRMALVFTGSADMTAADLMKALLPKVHADAVLLEVAEVVVDFRQLRFMNSSCLKSFVTWLNTLRDGEPPGRYRVVFRSNPERHWQHASLLALCSFAGDRARIEA